MYKNTKALVRTPFGDTDRFWSMLDSIKAQPLVLFCTFLLIMDTLTEDIREEQPRGLWKLLFADNLVKVVEKERSCKVGVTEKTVGQSKTRAADPTTQWD